MEISCVNAKRSTIDEPCCEPVSLVRARLTLTLTLFLKKKNNPKTSEIKLLLITGGRIGHRRKEKVYFPLQRSHKRRLSAAFPLEVLLSGRSSFFHTFSFAIIQLFFFFGLFSDKHSHPLVF